MITSAHSLFDQFRSDLRDHLAGLRAVDVSAHGADSGDIYSPALSENDLAIGFEPNANECTRLNLFFSLAAKTEGPDYSQPFRRLLQATNALSPDGGGQV